MNLANMFYNLDRLVPSNLLYSIIYVLLDFASYHITLDLLFHIVNGLPLLAAQL